MITFLVFCILVSRASCGLISESKGTAADDIDALTLVDLGKETHKPLLTLIGLAMRNLHPCEVWSPWTPCEATARGYYGTRTRTRQCVDKKSSESNTYKNETDIGLCEGKCPFGSNTTAHGYCLKLHMDKVKNYDDSESLCEDEGGYLINIDSAEKYDDVKKMLSGLKSDINIGGRRTTSSSPWVYKYGSQIPYIHWGSGDPDNASTDLCLMYRPSEHLWYDDSCTSKRQFLCEFI